MRLTVDGKSCPIGSLLKIPIGYSIESLKDPQSACKGRELEITIPSTAESNAIFGLSRDIYAAERFNDRHHTAQLECSGIVMFEGTLYLLESSMNERF